MPLSLSLAPFSFKLSTNIPLVNSNLEKLYPSYCFEEQAFTDYFLQVHNSGLIRQLFRKQARFLCDLREPFKPLDYSQAFAMLEWGMNWTVASHEMSFLLVHSAVLAKDGKAILFPAPPGSGKSTITTHLAFNGWQLLSDEMALINLKTGRCHPFVRPICLKNNSIKLAKKWFPHASFSSIAKDTHKGDVIHVSPPLSSWDMRFEEAEIVGIIYPQYTAGNILEIEALDNSNSFMQLSNNAFNFTALGKVGFDTIIKTVEKAKSFRVWHNNLIDLQDFIEEEIL